MRISLFLLLLSFNSFAQSDSSFQQFFENGIAEFQKPFEEQDFQRAVQQLEKAVALQPESAKALYYLGYAYSRLNCPDARSIPNMRLDLCLKTSETLERIPNPRLVIQDGPNMQAPVHKITSEWASLALSYALSNQTDSMKWALQQGKARGGFYDIPQGLIGRFLAALPPNSITFVMGDYNTFNFFYLQEIEQQRPDVQIVDVNLLNTTWYPEYLRQQGLNFGLSPTALQAVEYIEWADSTVQVAGLSWEVPPSYGPYLLRADQLLLRLLQTYTSERPCCFGLGIEPASQLGLDDHLQHHLFFNAMPNNAAPSIEELQQQLKSLLDEYGGIPPSEQGYFLMTNWIRNALIIVHNHIAAEELDKARALLDSLMPYAQKASAHEDLVSFMYKIQALIEELDE